VALVRGGKRSGSALVPAVIKAEIFKCDDSCKRGSPCSAFVIALTSPVKTKPGPLPTRIGSFACTNARLRHTNTRLANDDLPPFSGDFARRADPVDSAARHHKFPSDARTVIGNDLIADHSEARLLEFGRKLSGSHGLRVAPGAGPFQCPDLALQRAVARLTPGPCLKR
jgi:hypothetical protein